MTVKKIVYLFGAGATIAENQLAENPATPSLAHISEVVISKAKEGDLKDALKSVASDDITDIELFISLLESTRAKKYIKIANELRIQFCESLQEELSKDGDPIVPVLANSLLEMHNGIKDYEELVGVISLNYDNLLDRAFNKVYGGINYGVNCDCGKTSYQVKRDIPRLIKLHGAFNWRGGFPSLTIDEEQAKDGEHERMLWIPPSIQKDRDFYPFNSLWGQAFEMLNCDILRVVGCNLKQNDWGLLSLLYNTQLEANEPYRIEIIDWHEKGVDIRKRNGFLKKVKILGQLDYCSDLIDHPPENPFKSWFDSMFEVLTDNKFKVEELEITDIEKIRGGP